MNTDPCSLDPRLLERLLRGETSRAENLAVVRHLLRGCPRCESAARAAWPSAEAPQARLDLGRESPFPDKSENGAG